MSNWVTENLQWMYWTTPSALVFIILFAAIVGMGVWDRFSPGYARKGLLPMLTTRGDRFFVAVMTLVGVHLLWLGVLGVTLIWAPLAISAAAFVTILRWG